MAKTGQMVIPPAYDMAHKQAQGLAAVKADCKWGYVDKKGKMLIPPQYEVPIDTTYRELGVNVGSYLTFRPQRVAIGKCRTLRANDIVFDGNAKLDSV